MTDPAASPPGAAARPRSILFVVSSLRGGGAEFVSRTWMAWLAERGHSVSVVLTSAPVDAGALPAGVRAKTLAGTTGQLAKAAALRGILAESSPDAAISLQTHPNLVLLTAARGLPRRKRPAVLVSERNLVSLGLGGAPLSHRIKVWTAKRVYRQADHVIAISHPVAGELVAAFGVRGERITVVPNPATAKVFAPTVATAPSGTAGVAAGGVTDVVAEDTDADAVVFAASAAGAAAAAASAAASTGRGAGVSPSGAAPSVDLDETPGALQLVLACRLVAQKRPLLGIATAAELQRRGHRVEVVSFGGGPMLDEVVAAARREGVVFRHEGWVENWFERVGWNAVALLPSSREGFGNVLVEAAAAGHPSVAISGALGVADAIVPGITGELALSAEPADIANAVERAAGLRLSGIEPWLRRFSPEASGAALESVLERTLRDRKASR